ncbi:hypothetical protein TWF569_005515 [Orbilia oligospora]|uniref:Uncharacterized protein n=1 Tax=Orbilia oligospora TaxID=2813651 RepID=A0A7C8N910_ORBOL|nr:hypothetical protein TWF102_011401 [Orbilia oligospora]KAF3115720.1 hypothetical protein TWF706_005828 [Orbilia oligospora]KAF3117983.1 hypothetical protein TWF103_000024 [Orbilia oligospora]KAF3141438.1 hypothetical protein TWF594_005995 [Orbilia oligospora]KAF3156529.1 hypothetical protein TWF569_005515 [Orbilia oligospora]
MKLSCPSSWTISLQQKPVPCRTWTKKPYPGKNKEPHDARSRPASTETKGKNQMANNSTGNVVPLDQIILIIIIFFSFYRLRIPQDRPWALSQRVWWRMSPRT